MIVRARLAAFAWACMLCCGAMAGAQAAPRKAGTLGRHSAPPQEPTLFPPEYADSAEAGAIRWSSAAYVAAVLEASDEVKDQREAVFSAEAALGAKMADAYLPTISLSGALTPAKFAESGTRFTFATWRLDANDLNVTPAVNWNLFNSFQDARSVRISRLGLQMSRQDMESSLQDRAQSALEAFYDLLLQDRLLDVARQSYRAQKDQYDLTLDQYHRGMKSLSDLLKTETDLQSADLGVADADAQKRLSLFRFNSLLNRDEGTPVALEQDLAFGTTALPDLGEGLREALRSRPEMVKSRLSLEQADLAYRQALQGVLPSLSLDFGAAQAWRAGYGSQADRFAWRYSTYGLALRLALPASFNLYSQVADARMAGSAWRRSRLTANMLARRIREQVYQSHISLAQAVRSYGISLRKEQLSRQNLDLVMEQYNQGTADVIRLSSARLDLIQAQTQRLTAFRNANLQRAQYRRAIGEPIWR